MGHTHSLPMRRTLPTAQGHSEGDVAGSRDNSKARRAAGALCPGTAPPPWVRVAWMETWSQEQRGGPAGVPSSLL